MKPNKKCIIRDIGITQFLKDNFKETKYTRKDKSCFFSYSHQGPDAPRSENLWLEQKTDGIYLRFSRPHEAVASNLIKSKNGWFLSPMSTQKEAIKLIRGHMAISYARNFVEEWDYSSGPSNKSRILFTSALGPSILLPVNVIFSKGTIVKYKTGWMQVRAVFKETVNLGPIFGSKTTVKKVSQSEVYPDHDNWNAVWSKSETYQSM